ncbi:MAG: metallophosphoesterase [Acidobacteriaceae bacterium]
MKYFFISLGIVLVTSIFVLFHWFIYRTSVRFFDIQSVWLRRTLLITLVTLSLSIVLASLISSRYFNGFSQALYKLIGNWSGFFAYFFIASCLAWIIYAFTRDPSAMKWVTGILYGLAVVVGIYGMINARNLRTTEFEVAIPNLPQEWQGKTAVWVSDVHLGQVNNDKYADEIIDRTNELQPDIVFLGGDYFDGLAVDSFKLADKLKKINAKWGTYFITGNHEEFADDYDHNQYIEALDLSGIRILNNEKIDVHGMQLVGVDFHATNSRKDFQAEMDSIDVDKTKPAILLKHVPSALDISEKEGISLQISGHTHRGQIFPGGLLSCLVYRGYDYGFKSHGKLQVITSSGAGTFGPAMRVGTVSEIVKITFK